MLDAEPSVGMRLRVLRRWRKLTLTELAGLAGLSPSFLSMVENGQRLLDRRSHIAALASALRVSETDLVGGPHLSADPVQADPHSVIPALRAALQTNSLDAPMSERARPLSELVAEVQAVEPLYYSCDYVRLGERLPPVIDELYYHAAHPEDEASYRQTLEALVDSCMFATFRSKDLGYLDLAHIAADRAAQAAAILNDPIQQGKAAYLRVQTMPRNGSWNRTLLAAERAANTLEPHVKGGLGVQVLGMLTLSASLAAASVHDGAKASAWLEEAAELADRIPDTPQANWSSFSATNVGVWRVAVSVEHGASGKPVLELASKVNHEKLAVRSSRHAAFLADVGRGLARDRATRSIAVGWLQRAENVAPQRIRNSGPARETVLFLLDRARAAAVGRELRGMASRMGVPAN